MKNLLTIISISLLISLSYSCESSENEFNQVEYYKDSQMNRVFAVITSVKDTTKLIEYGENKSHTIGGITKVYFYDDINKAKPITMLDNIMQVYERLDGSSPFAIFTKNPREESSLLFLKENLSLPVVK